MHIGLGDLYLPCPSFESHGKHPSTDIALLRTWPVLAGGRGSPVSFLLLSFEKR